MIATDAHSPLRPSLYPIDSLLVITVDLPGYVFFFVALCLVAVFSTVHDRTLGTSRGTMEPSCYVVNIYVSSFATLPLCHRCWIHRRSECAMPRRQPQIDTVVGESASLQESNGLSPVASNSASRQHLSYGQCDSGRVISCS